MTRAVVREHRAETQRRGITAMQASRKEALEVDMAESLNTAVEYAPLRSRDGEYRHDLSRIRLREGISERLTRWTPAHKLGHAHCGHELLLFGRADSRQERAADEWAALHTIDPHQYREVEADRDGHVPSMAHDLGIVSRGVRVYQSLLARLGEHVYVHPRHGAGQYAGRLTAQKQKKPQIPS